MGQIEWAMWANEQAVVSGVCLLMGSIIGIAGSFKNWQLAACVLVESIFILVLEWPRSKRTKGNTIERKFQIYLTKMLNKLQPASSNYYVRFVLHLILSIPCCFLLPTIMGGLALMITAIIYLVAAMKGEEWKPVGIEPAQAEVQSTSEIPMPDRPAPRLRLVQAHDGNNMNNPNTETSFNQI